MSDSVTIRVPATTANLGPGFDCLGMALSLWNTMRVGWADRPTISLHGLGAEHLRRDPGNLIYRSAERVLIETGNGGRSLSIEAWQEIPHSRGLGSSSAAIVGGIYATNALLGYPLSPHRLLELATEIEGHPDNVAPALMGRHEHRRGGRRDRTRCARPATGRPAMASSTSRHADGDA